MSYIDDIVEKLRLFIEDKISLYDLVDWADKSYNDFIISEDYKILNYRLINDILIQIRNLADVVSGQNVINNIEKKYFHDEISKMLNLLTGKESYFEVYKIKEKSSRYQLLRKTIDEHISKIMNNNIIQEEELYKSKLYLLKRKHPVKEDIILIEIIQTILYLNEAIRVESEEVFIGMLGSCRIGLKVENEKEYLIKLKEILEGKRAYRLSLGLNITSIIYTNIVLL